MKLLKIVQFNGKLNVLESGLRIGGSSDVAGIGEVDNPIIRNPITKTPYIPGSSLKGKIRSLLEVRNNKMSERGGPCDCGRIDCNVCNIFGCGFIGNAKSLTRIIFRDCYPDKKTMEIWENHSIDSEEKTEVTLNRKNMKANPRSNERIPANSSFDFSFSLKFFEDDNKKTLLSFLADGFELLEKDYLGGSGSRGYGHVEVIADNGKHMHEYLRSEEVLKKVEE